MSHGGMGVLSVTQFSTAYRIKGQFTEEWSFKPDLHRKPEVDGGAFILVSYLICGPHGDLV